MITTQERDRVLILLERIRRVHIILATSTTELHRVAGRWKVPDESQGRLANLLGSKMPNPALMFNVPIADFGATSVTWRGRTCRLGNTILFRLMVRLVQHPNNTQPFDRLLRLVWEGPKSDLTIRSATAVTPPQPRSRDSAAAHCRFIRSSITIRRD